jgi:hypothetical protein
MEHQMSTLAQQIETLATAMPEGEPLSAKALLHLGSREAVDQALSRLVKRKKLMRAARGLYIRPVEGKFGSRPPSSGKVIEALAGQTGEMIAPSGAAAANSLGLTTQVPVKEVYLTSGRGRTLKLGNQVVELQHAPAWQTALPKSRSGQVIRALSWLGQPRAQGAMLALKQQLAPSEVQELLNMRRVLPSWMAQEISRMVPRG